MARIILGDSAQELREIADLSVDLLIADPPYWKVVSEKWDYKWRTEQDYVEWSLTWIREASRVLRYGGSFYLFGYFRILALLVPFFDEMGLELRQQIIIDKGMKAVSGRATKKYKLFPNTTESILFIIKDNKKYIKSFLKQHQQKMGLNARQINDALGVKSNGGGMWSIYTGNNICGQFPTEEIWNKLQTILGFELPYKSISQTYNPQMGLTDVWRDIDFYNEMRTHPTQKPLSLIKRLILASSNEGDLVLDPFAGSGSTAIASMELNRRNISIEIEEKYLLNIINRIEDHRNNLGNNS
ncbi:MAG: site-specific DNA-methyltransferase [Rikenellaceae bacterium]|nr:site-specific DNA-methyltransferase [Rikenellaceae bacterium]